MVRCNFPFTAVIGQERVKKALILSVINPRIGGVLISGERGTAKSTLVRGLADVIDGMEVVELPLNITEDRLIGSLDMEAAIARGKRSFEPGLLQKADGNILYVDEVNLLSEHIANCLLETAASGVNIVEREGISGRHDSRFVLVGTMNPEEGDLRPQLIDRFGLFTEVPGELDRRNRTEIIRRRLDYESNPTAYREQWQEASRALCERIQHARELLSQIQPSDANLSLAATLSRQAACAGHRAEIIIIEAARAIAAFDNRREIMEDDICESAGYVLPHRRREPILFCDDIREELIETSGANTEAADVRGQAVGDTPHDMPDFEAYNTATPDTGLSERERLEQPRDMPPFSLTDIRLNTAIKPQGSGKRTRVKSDSRQGRYVKYQFPSGRLKDLALDATLRAAAPFQVVRKDPHLAVVIKPPDTREKVKEKHTGCVVLFVVDASGSMGARRRMGAVKGAVISLLSDVYRKRDRVGVIAFRKDSATTLLGITRSVNLAHKCLKELPTGGRTPLAAGLAKARELLRIAKIKEPDMLPYLVLVSDGKANVAFNGDNAVADAIMIARRIRHDGLRCLVLDTEDGYIRLGLAKKIAEVLDARYVKMDDVSASDIKARVKQLVT